jgi:hypothetical protein
VYVVVVMMVMPIGMAAFVFVVVVVSTPSNLQQNCGDQNCENKQEPNRLLVNAKAPWSSWD